MTPAAGSTFGSTARSAAPTGDPWPIATIAPVATARLHQRTAALRHLSLLARGDPDYLFRQDHVLERRPSGTPGLGCESAAGLSADAAPSSARTPLRERPRSGSLSPGNRWFESISLLRRVCKLSVPSEHHPPERCWVRAYGW